MTCKDCIHEEICIAENPLVKTNYCYKFRNKAEYAEVVYAEWVDKYDNKYYNHLYVCSNCGGKALYGFYQNELDQTKEQQILSTGCPHCCARMRNAIGGVKE